MYITLSTDQVKTALEEYAANLMGVKTAELIRLTKKQGTNGAEAEIRIELVK